MFSRAKSPTAVSMEAHTSHLGSPVSEWLAKFEASKLKAKNLRKYWATEVPKYYSPRRDCDCLNITYNEEEARKVLFLPLERFITAEIDTEYCLSQLKNLDDPPMLCGRVFRNGEPTYSCRDCSLDPTCVLCVDCFTNRFVSLRYLLCYIC